MALVKLASIHEQTVTMTPHRTLNTIHEVISSADLFEYSVTRRSTQDSKRARIDRC